MLLGFTHNVTLSVSFSRMRAAVNYKNIKLSFLPSNPQINLASGFGSCLRKSIQVIPAKNRGKRGSFGASSKIAGITGRPRLTKFRKNASILPDTI